MKPKKATGRYVKIISHEFDCTLTYQLCEKLPEKFNVNKRVPPKLFHQVWNTSARFHGDRNHKWSLTLKNDPARAMEFIRDWNQAVNDAAKILARFFRYIAKVGLFNRAAITDLKEENTWSLHKA